MKLPCELYLMVADEIKKNMWRKQEYVNSLGIANLYYGKRKYRPAVSKQFVTRKHLAELDEIQHPIWNIEHNDLDDCHLEKTVTVTIGIPETTKSFQLRISEYQGSEGVTWRTNWFLFDDARRSREDLYHDLEYIHNQVSLDERLFWENATLADIDA